MSRDVYVSLSGANAAWAEIQSLANDVANVSTTGFKRQRISFELQGEGSDLLGEAYAVPVDGSADMSDGPLVQDGEPTHLALRGVGFFALQGTGGTLLSRSGEFRLGPDGELLAAGGEAVLGQSGAVRIPPGERFQVSSDGRILDSGGEELDRLRIVDGDAEPIGGSVWRATGPLVEARARVVQGALEGSNVDPVGAMIDLVQASRLFEAYQKAVQTSDELDGRLNQTGAA